MYRSVMFHFLFFVFFFRFFDEVMLRYCFQRSSPKIGTLKRERNSHKQPEFQQEKVQRKHVPLQGSKERRKVLIFNIASFLEVFKCSRGVILHPTSFPSSAPPGPERRRTLLRLHDQRGGGTRGAAGRQEAAEGPGFSLPPRPQDPVQCCPAIAALSSVLGSSRL